MSSAQDLLNQFLGQLQTPQQGAGPQGAAQKGAAPGGLNLDSLLNGKAGLATGAVAGGLAGLLLGGKKPRKLAKSALKVGGIALVGGLAYKAWSDWQANKAPAPQTAPAPETLPSPEGTSFLPETDEAKNNLGKTLIRAMIAAAKADGHVSVEEQNRIAEQLKALDLDAEDRDFIEDELSKPLNIDEITSAIAGPEQAAEVYAASLLAIDPDGMAEKGYLSMLAARLDLAPELVAHLHAGAEAITASRTTQL